MEGFVQTHERWSENEDLLPGIPDDITLNHIVTKLPWRALHLLPSLCRGWQLAIESRQVYDARVFHHATETLVLHSRMYKRMGVLVTSVGLYSVLDKSNYLLPPIPNVEVGVPKFCQCLALEDKIYVLGGARSHQDSCFEVCSEKVYVLDLVGRRQWKQCASMRESKKYFVCGVVDGKIYVFGDSEFNQGCGSEVYDPKKDAWSPIAPMPSPQLYRSIMTLGEELVVYDEVKGSLYLDVYQPAKNEWRRLEHVGRLREWGFLFVANGELHAMMPTKLARVSTALLVINVFNTDNFLWTCLHFSPLAELFEPGYVRVFSVELALNGEVLAFVELYGQNGLRPKYLLQSKGFGAERSEIVWEKVELPLTWNLCRPLHSFVHL